ncbi:hypothetical protein KUTeg_012173 [Tegillarca granosa]|uniref:Uncharacterized protein n=1 Tax=Tegillarca granosa TaxID=220873 RepID=A0ABQ9EYT6_TEGGR|nr:hypothetical protein KUTeg_012173 [Tegillarca granosa]
MHDGEKVEHVHENNEDEKKNGGAPVEPQDPNEQMHDLMHDGEKVIHPDTSGIEKKHPKDVSLKSLPSGDELHGVLMHGDSEMGHDHEKEHAERKNKPFKFDIEKIKEIVPEDILKTVNLEKLMKVEKEDYKKWKDEEKKTKGDKSRVSSFSFVVDTIFSNIDKIKQKFISKSDQNSEDNTEKNLKFAADAIQHLGHDPNDVRHDLELIGNTAPISERHKSFTWRNNKERHEM